MYHMLSPHKTVTCSHWTSAGKWQVVKLGRAETGGGGVSKRVIAVQCSTVQCSAVSKAKEIPPLSESIMYTIYVAPKLPNMFKVMLTLSKKVF